MILKRRKPVVLTETISNLFIATISIVSLVCVALIKTQQNTTSTNVLTIKSSTSEVQIGDEFVCEITFSNADNTTTTDNSTSIEFTVDFDDDSSHLISEWGNETTYKHRYFIPGRYRATVYTKIQTTNWTRVLSNWTWVVATSKLDNHKVQFDCPQTIKSVSNAYCNLTINEGYGLEATIDFNDGSGVTEFTLPDIKNKILGTGIPQYHSSRILDKLTLKRSDLLIINMRTERIIDTPAVIQAIEGYCASDGGLELIILRKVCPQSKPNSVDICRLFPPNEDDQYTNVGKYMLSEKEGHFYIKIISDLRVLSGDMIGIRSTGGQLASRRIKRNEMPDYKLENATSNLVVEKQHFREIEGIKHLIRLIVNEPLRVIIPVDVRQSGTHNISFSVKNKWTPTAVRRERSMEIKVLLKEFDQLI